jgi:hypothetical protein
MGADKIVRARHTIAELLQSEMKIASADSAPRIGFGFGIWNTFQRRFVGIFGGFLFGRVDFLLLFGILSGVSAAAHTCHASHASRVPHFLRNR